MDNCRDFCQNRLRSFLMYRVGLLIVALALAPGSSAFAQQQAPQISDKLKEATAIYLAGDNKKTQSYAEKCLEEKDYDTAYRLLMLHAEASRSRLPDDPNPIHERSRRR